MVVDLLQNKQYHIARPAWNQIFNRDLNGYNDAFLNRMMATMSKKELLSFAIGMASLQIKPPLNVEGMADMMDVTEGIPTILQQCSLAGHYELWQMICNHMQERGKNCTPEQVMLLSGSQQEIDLIARALVEKGDIVVMEEPTYFLAYQSFQMAGARIVQMPMDQYGMNLAILEQFVKRYHPKVVYTMPTYHNPTTVCMSDNRREKLVMLAEKYGFIIVEDDAYQQFEYDEEVHKPLASYDHAGYVIYLSTFSKRLTQGLRLGYMVADHDMIEKCSMIRQTVDIHPNTISQWLVMDAIKSGKFQLHMKAVRKEYREKRDLMERALTKYAPKEMDWNTPTGGYYFWCRLPDNVRASELLERTIAKGVAFMPGVPFYQTSVGEQYIRLNFTYIAKERIEEGIKVVCQTMADIMKNHQINTKISATELQSMY